MGKKIPEQKWRHFFGLLDEGMTRENAADLSSISLSTIERLFHDPSSTSGHEHFLEWRARTAPTAKERKSAYDLSAVAALDDFALFRRRYFGRVPVPWQTQVAERTVQWSATPDREYVVISVAPGSGKTTLNRDLVCWLLARDRSLRIMWGSRVYAQSLLNVNKIRDELTRSAPLKASSRELEHHLAYDADATLASDFGRFKPDKDETEFWTRERFTVVQSTGTTAKDKEASLTAFGFDGGYLGGRFDICVWDDVDDMRSVRASEPVREAFLEQWGQVAENRLEPGGVFLVVGQRLAAVDLYRHCLDQADIDGRPIYQHITYPAHFDEQCRNEHGSDAQPWPDGCLLDPVRLPHKLLKNKAGQRQARYRVVYQQEDVDPDSVLIPRLWIDGGLDHETREDHPGCWDEDRRLRELPRDLPPGCKTVISFDPSGSKQWALGAWIIHPPTEQRWLVDFWRDTLTMDELLDQEVHSGTFTGVIEDMWQALNRIGRPPSHVIPEHNAAQRHIVINSRWDNWKRQRGLTILVHHTGRWNKADPQLGLDTLRPGFQYGRIRLPGRSRPELKVFVDEHTNHPAWPTDDTVLMNWFVELNYRRLFPVLPDQPVRSTRPSWIKGRNRRVAA